MQNNNPALPNNDQGDDKTIIYSSSNSVTDKKESDNEKTKIQDSPASKPTAANEAKEIVNTPQTPNDSIPNKLAELNSKKTDSKISTGLFAGGIAAAAVGGVAAGTAFSDEIKDAFTPDGFNAPESPEAEAQQVDGSTDQGIENASNIHQTAFHEGGSSTNLPPVSDNISSFEISSTDIDGNIYSVSLSDFDGNGSIDSQTGNIQLVDGTSVSFTQTGENLSPLFGEGTEIALPNEYQGQASFASYLPVEGEFSTGNDSYVYQVQAGDTLSEIAEANNTSVEHIMELNPEITDPHTIHTADHLLIPENDNISNPYAGGVGLGGNIDTLADSNQPIVSDDSNQTIISDASIAEGTHDASYEQVDWASFSDDAANIENSEYEEELSQTDFDSIETPESYIDLSFNDFDNTDVSSDFI